jgi:hypothetical protein
MRHFFQMDVRILRCRLLVALLGMAMGLVSWGNQGWAQLVPNQPETFFITPATESVLSWTVLADSGGERNFLYRIVDYAGKTVSNGEARSQSGKVSITVSLLRGYYDVVVGTESFGLVVQPPYLAQTDPFFGIDAVLNWLDRRPEMRAAMVRSLKRSGIAMARERINWNTVEPKPGQFDWQETDHAWDLRRIYEKEKLPVLEMFHSPGPARGPFPVKNSYPQDLALLEKSWPVIHEKFKATWGGLEVWNEPEGPYGSYLPADQYVTVVRAMRCAFQENKIDSPLGGGVFIGGDPGAFHEFCTRNGMLDLVDFVSLHDYKPATKMERLISVHREWLKQSGKEGLPLWVTESGWSWPKGGGRPALDRDQESALQIAMKGVEAKACGVARYMPFCLAFYEEGGIKSFSMMGKDVTPLRSMGAYVQSVRVLSGKQYVGDLEVKDPSILRARVFEGRNETGKMERIIVLYTDVVEEGETVTLPVKSLRMEGIDGRKLSLTADGKIPVPDGMVYIWSDEGLIDPNTVAMALLESGKKKVSARMPVNPLVLQYIPDSAQVIGSSTDYRLPGDRASAMNVRVKLHNLLSKEQSLAVTLGLPGEDLLAGQKRRQMATVPAMSTAEVNWTIDVRGIWKTPEPQPVSVNALDAKGRQLSSLSIPLMVEEELAGYLPLYSRHEKLPLTELSRWKKNAAPKTEMKFEKTVDKNWKLSASFLTGDRWVYPKFSIKPGLLARADGFLLRARSEKAAQIRMVIYKENGTAFLTADPVIPADGKWHVSYVSLKRFEPNQNAESKDNGQWIPEEINAVSIGFNDQSKDHSNSLEVSDLIAVEKRK